MPGLVFTVSRVAVAMAFATLAIGCGSGSKDDATEDRVTEPTGATANANKLPIKKIAGPYKPPSHFVEYRDTRVGFLVWAPRKPTSKITPLTTPSGKTLAEEFNFGVDGANHTMLITVTQLPAEKGAPLDAEGAVANARDGMRRKLSGRLASDIKWEPKGPDGKKLVGREFRIDGKVGQQAITVYARLLVRDAWLYQAMAMHSGSRPTNLKDGDAFVQSFRLGPRPKARKLLPPGVLPIKITTPTIEVLQKFKEPKFYLKVRYGATVVHPLVPLEQVFYKVWCKLGAVQKTFERGSQGLRAVAAKTTKQLQVAPFLDQPLDAQPETCQVEIQVRKAATTVASLGSYCYAQQKVTKGACPK